MSMGQHMLDRGAQMLQSLKPIKKMSQHVYTFAIYSHDISRQIETHHYISKINRDFLQCAVYDTDDSNGLSHRPKFSLCFLLVNFGGVIMFCISFLPHM